jgi:signal transduction histidine kinase
MDATAIAIVTVAHYGILFVAAGVGRWQHVVRAQRAAAAREAAATERLTLARELHDIVAHAVTVMLLQAAGARRVMAVDPRRADEALASIEDVGVGAVGELRRLLAVLRAGETSADGAAASTPLHEIDDIDTLIDGFRRAGLSVTVDTRGSARRVDSSVGLTAYRVVQEALTNASRHAGAGARAAVVLDWRQDALVVNVHSEGVGSRTRRTRLSTGYGVVGLTERVALVDGELRFERSPGDGFEVTASLPLADAAPVRS